MREIAVRNGGGIFEIRLHRPEKKNALTIPMFERVTAALREAEADSSVRVILICAEGTSFCAGNDLQNFQNDRGEPDFETDFTFATDFMNALSVAGKVLVAAVQGAAIGVGATLLLHCDFVVAAENARLSYPFARIGLVPECASTLLLPRAIGHLRASELLLLGDAVDAKTAQGLGLVNRVVPLAELEETARGLAQELARRPAAALLRTKRLLRAEPEGLADRIARETREFIECVHGSEFRRAATAFFEKRSA